MGSQTVQSVEGVHSEEEGKLRKERKVEVNRVEFEKVPASRRRSVVCQEDHHSHNPRGSHSRSSVQGMICPGYQCASPHASGVEWVYVLPSMHQQRRKGTKPAFRNNSTTTDRLDEQIARLDSSRSPGPESSPYISISLELRSLSLETQIFASSPPLFRWWQPQQPPHSITK